MWQVGCGGEVVRVGGGVRAGGVRVERLAVAVELAARDTLRRASGCVCGDAGG